MSALSNPLAIAALNRALKKVRSGPVRRPKFDSRTADKFVIRGFVELFDELKGIGLHQGRSMNSEAIAAILDAMDGQVRSLMLVKVLKERLGDPVCEQVLAQIPDFELEGCTTPALFVVRLPPNVREIIRNGVAQASSSHGSMKEWVLEALVKWVNVQRQQYALMTATIAMEPTLLGHQE